MSSRPTKVDPDAFTRLLSVVPEEFFKQREFNPFAHYNDDPNELTEYAEVIELGVEKVVSVHGKALNSTTATFTRVLDTFSQSQTQLNQAQLQLQESRDLLNGSGSSSMSRVAELWATSARYDACVELLKKLEFVTQAPTLVTELRQSNQYLHAVVLLNQTLAYLNDEDLREIDGLIDLREQMLEDKNTLIEELIQQIHQIIYHQRSVSDAAQDANRRDESSRDRDYSVSSAHRRVASHHRTLSSVYNQSGRTRELISSSLKGDALLPDDSLKPANVTPLARLQSSPLNPFVHHGSASLLEEENLLASVLTQRPSRFLLFLVAACDHLNALPTVRTQLTKRLRAEISSVIEREMQAVRQARGPHKPISHKQPVEHSQDPEHCILLDSRDTNSETEATLAAVSSRVFSALLIAMKHHIDLAVEIMNRTGDQSTRKPGDARFGVGPVWETVQISVQMLLLEILRAGPAKLSALSVASVSAAKKNFKTAETEITFSFEDARIPSIVKMSRGQNHPTEAAAPLQEEDDDAGLVTASLVSPSPYHIVTLYRPLVGFIDQSVAMMSSLHSSSSGSSQLRDFLSVFLMTAFIPRVQADFNRTLDTITNDPRAFLPVPPTSELSNNVDSAVGDQSYVIRAVVSLVPSVRALISDMTCLPHSINDLLSVLDSVLDRFVQRCSDRIAELTRGSFSTSSLLDSRLLDTARGDPAFDQFQHTRNTKTSSSVSCSAFFSNSSPLYSPFLDGSLTLKRQQLIDDPVALEQLGLLSASFEWLADQLFALTQRKNHSSQPQYFNRSARMYLLDSSNVSSRSLISARASEWCRWCLALSDRCLINLRIELHYRVVTGLSSMTLSNYYAPSAPTSALLEPEPFILALNSDLSKFDDAVSAACSTDRLVFIYAGLFEWLAVVILSNLNKIKDKRMSAIGVAQILRNMQALQQQATHFTQGSHKEWEAVKSLVELLVEDGDPANHLELTAEHARILADVRQANTRGKM